MQLNMLYLAVIYTYSFKNNKMVSWRQGAKEAAPFQLIFSTLQDQQLWSSFERSATSLGMTRMALESQKRDILPWCPIKYLFSSSVNSVFPRWNMGSLPSKSSSGAALSDQSLIHHQPTTWKVEHYVALYIFSSIVMPLWPQPPGVSGSSFKVLSCHRFSLYSTVNSSPTLPSSGFLKADFAVLWFFNYAYF